MALIPKDSYGGQTIQSDAGYPYGKARNKATAGDTNGTPLERAWVNDLWGSQQALLTEAGLVPTGNPDKVGNSQYLDALLALMARAAANAQPTIVMPPLALLDNIGDRWGVSGGPGLAGFVLRQNDITDGGLLRFSFSLPYVGMKIKTNGIRVYFKGAPGHGGIPTFWPQMQFGVRTLADLDNPIDLAVEEKDDWHATLDSYEIVHQINGYMFSRDIVQSDQYLITIQGEWGPGSLVGLEFYGIRVDLEPQ
jgi:hypothetical protein